VTDRQADHATCIATGRIFTLCIAMRPKNYSERQNWRHQSNETKLVSCKRVIVAVGAKLHARDVCSCTSLSVFVYRVRALSAATTIYTSVTVDLQDCRRSAASSTLPCAFMQVVVCACRCPSYMQAGLVGCSWIVQ